MEAQRKVAIRGEHGKESEDKKRKEERKTDRQKRRRRANGRAEKGATSVA